MKSYIDNRGVYHRFIDWAKLFGRKKDTEETPVEEVVEIQEPITVVDEVVEPQGVVETSTESILLDDDFDGPFVDYLDEGDVEVCDDDFDGPYDCPDVINDPLELNDQPSDISQDEQENICPQEEMPEEMPAEMPEELPLYNEELPDKAVSRKSKKSEKVVKEKSTAKKTAKKTATKSRKI